MRRGRTRSHATVTITRGPCRGAARGGLLGVGLALLLAACDAGERLRPRPSEALASFAAYERCLIGSPLDTNEPLSQRLRGIELRQTPGWPERCRPLGEQALRVADAEELRDVLRSSDRPMTTRDEAWDRLHQRFALPPGELSPGIEPPPAPLQPPPTPAPLLELGSRFLNTKAAPTSLGAARFLVSAPGDDRHHLCELERVRSRWVGRCDALPSADERDPRLSEAEPGSPLALLFSRRPHVLAEDGHLERLSSHPTGTLFLARHDGALLWFETLRGKQLHRGFDLHVRSPSGDEATHRLAMERADREQLVVRGTGAWWTRKGKLLRAELDAGSVAKQLAAPVEVGPFAAGHGIGPLCRAGGREVLMTSRAHPKRHEATTRAVRLFMRAEPSAAWTYVDTEVVQDPSTTQLAFFTAHAPAAKLSCDARGARLTNDRPRALETVRCTDAGCSPDRVEMGAFDDAWARRSAWRGERLLVVWNPSTNGRGQGLRMRLAAPETLAEAPDALLLDNDQEKLEELELLELEDATLVLVAWDGHLHGLWIDDSGTFGPIEPD